MSTDTAMTVPVLTEVLDMYANQGVKFQYGCCIYPCAPFVTAKRLKESMELLAETKADTVVPLVKFSYPPQRGFVIREGRTSMLYPENYNMRSQDLEPMYHDAGQFYCFNVVSLIEQGGVFCKNTLPLVLSELEAQDIDTLEDWKIAEIKYAHSANGELT